MGCDWHEVMCCHVVLVVARNVSNPCHPDPRPGSSEGQGTPPPPGGPLYRILSWVCGALLHSGRFPLHSGQVSVDWVVGLVLWS